MNDASSDNGNTRSGASLRRRTIVSLSISLAVMATAFVLFTITDRDPRTADVADAGSVLTGVPVPVTAGRGYDGQPIQVPRPGRPALVTFLFADCADVCPLAAEQIRLALDRVGPAAARQVDVVAVSVDPAGDTGPAVRAFLRRHRLEGRMDYIIGTKEQLRPLWSAWRIAAQPDGESRSLHSARIVLVDRDGRQAESGPAGVPVPVSELTRGLEQVLGG